MIWSIFVEVHTVYLIYLMLQVEGKLVKAERVQHEAPEIIHIYDIYNSIYKYIYIYMHMSNVKFIEYFRKM